VTKLIAKVRKGNRTKKVYDDPQPPYQRVLDSPQVSESEKRKLRAVHAKLDVVKLKRQIEPMLDDLEPSRFG
jgi:hypothetical protein